MVSSMPPRWLVAGSGYVGMRLVQRLTALGAEVWLTRRSSEAAARAAAAATARGLTLDLDGGGDAWPEDTVVVDLVPPGADGGAREQRLIALAQAARSRRVVYISSTGVYSPGHGAWVDEEFSTVPPGTAGQARLAAERSLIAAADDQGLPWLVLRAAGIYGPDRGVVARMRAGGYRLVGDGRAFVSRIHVDDLVTAIIAAGQSHLTQRVVNIADDEPITAMEYATAVSAHLGLPMPPTLPVASVDSEVAAMFTADRRIANTVMKRELGVVLRYPSWRVSLDEGAARMNPG
jgi:nucleoside-diphosphate-sugar epimerase